MQESSHFSESPWKEHLETAVRAAREAGRIQLEAFDKPHTIGFKGETNLVTEVDRACKEAIFSFLRDAFPSHDFLLEESVTQRTDSPFLWVVDPLDGTTNYTTAIPISVVPLPFSTRERRCWASCTTRCVGSSSPPSRAAEPS